MRGAGFSSLVAPLAPFAAAFAVGLASATTAALAQEEPLDPALASVDWPPPGPRLRELATRLDLDVGFAARRFWPELPEAAVYGDIASAEFNVLTPESSFRLEYTQPEEGRFDFGAAGDPDALNDLDAMFAFAEANDMRVYGLPLTWYFQTPEWLETVPRERMAAVLQEQVTRVVSRYAGRVKAWGVVNEALDEPGTGYRAEEPFFAALGPGYVDIAFRAARAADPGATLFYNDFDIGWPTEKSALALELVDGLIERDVPIDAVGLQMHVFHAFDRFEGLSETMQRIVDRDLDVYVTELDVRISDPAKQTQYGVQADVFEEVIRRCLMQPRCQSVNVWGLDDFYSWQPFFDPLPFDENFRVKPAYFGMRRALSTQPLHPEGCALGNARVSRGTVYAAASSEVAPVASPVDAFSLDCGTVTFDGGFTSVDVRYRNAGADTPELEIVSGGETIATLALEPTLATPDGDYRTVTVTVPAMPDTADITLRVGAVSDGREVGIDALLFGDPTRPLDLARTVSRSVNTGSDGGTDTGGDGSGTGADGGVEGGADDGTGDGADGGTEGGTGGGEDGSTNGETDGGDGGTAGGVTGDGTTDGTVGTADGVTDGASDGGTRSEKSDGGLFGIGGANGAFWLVVLGGVLGCRRKRGAGRARSPEGAPRP